MAELNSSGINARPVFSPARELGDLIIFRIFIRLSTYSKNSRVFFHSRVTSGQQIHAFICSTIQDLITTCTQTQCLQETVAINRLHLTVFDIVKALVNIH